MDQFINIVRAFYNIRGINRIMNLFHLDYNNFFKLVWHTNNNLDINRSYIIKRKIKNVIFELDLYKPTQRSIYFEGVYERENLKLILKSIKKDSVFIDVGAHIGYYSIILGKKLLDGCVISFEPSKENYLKLVRNIALNNLQHIIKAYRFALSDKNEEKTLFLNKYNDGGNSLEKSPCDSISEEKINCFRFDDLNPVKYSQIDFIKIDVEGHQNKVLDGMKRTIVKFSPSFLIEAQKKKEQDQIIDFLKQFGYTKFYLNTHGLDILCKK